MDLTPVLAHMGGYSLLWDDTVVFYVVGKVSRPNTLSLQLKL